MTGLEKYLRSGEAIGRSAGVSYVSLAAKAVALTCVVFLYWLVTRVLMQFSSGSPLSEYMQPILDIAFAAFTAILGLMVAFRFAGLCLRAAFWRYGLTDSRILKRTFLRMRAADIAHVQDVEVIQSITGKLLGYGNVVVRTASTEGTIVLRSIDRPYDWFRDIHEMVRMSQMQA